MNDVGFIVFLFQVSPNKGSNGLFSYLESVMLSRSQKTINSIICACIIEYMFISAIGVIKIQVYNFASFRVVVAHGNHNCKETQSLECVQEEIDKV